MSLPFILFVATLAALLGFLYIRAGKQRGKDNGGSGGDGGLFFHDSDSHCDNSGGDCGGDGGGGD